MEKKFKFKIGDTVEILDGKNIPKYFGGWCMGNKVGKIGKITKCKTDERGNGYYLDVDNSYYVYDERGLKLVTPKNEQIIIYRKDDTVVALDKRTGETAIARCNPIDTFDFNVGAKLALRRLLGFEEPVTPEVRKPYNGKVVCIASSPTFAYTVGKIYEFKNGKTKLDNGIVFPIDPVFSFEEFAKECVAKCIEIVE